MQAAVIGGAPHARHRAERLLGEAGFGIVEPAPHRPAELILAFLTDATDAVDAVRVSDVRALAASYADALILAVMPAGAPNASLRRVMLAGATGIVLEDGLDRTLVPTARATLAGQLTVPNALGRQIAPRPLSHREKQILALVMAGASNHEIATKLFLAESTVKTHLSSAFRKLDARSRAEAVTRITDPENGYGTGILEIANGSLAATS